MLSKDKEDCSKLKVVNRKILELGKIIKNDNKLNIVIMHHGIEHLGLSDARKFAFWTEDNNIDLVCCGHTHSAAVNSYDDLQRDIKQFTSGAIAATDGMIPGFYIFDNKKSKSEVEILLYSYADKKRWMLDNQSLRKFQEGKYIYKLSRHMNMGDAEKGTGQETEQRTKIEKDVLEVMTPEKLNLKYFDKYGMKIYSSRHEGKEDFNSWKIIHSLVEIGVGYTKAFEITCEVVESITSDEFQSIDNLLSSNELRDIVYETIINYSPSLTESEYEIGCWASKYARKYVRSKEMMVIDRYKRQEKLNYYYVKNTLLKNAIDAITSNKVFYEKIFKNEMNRMAEDVLDFLKNMEIFEIREEALLEIIKEYITQKPHPWLINKNREEIVAYHKRQGGKHINDLQDKGGQTKVTQVEAAYHVCAALLAQYDSYIGCTEVSPINILVKTINNMSNKFQRGKFVLPMQKYQIIQMKKDLEGRQIDFEELKKDLNVLYKNIVEAQKLSMPETNEALIQLWGILLKLEEEETPLHIQQEETSVDRVRNIFIGAKGFVVKANLRELKNCFWVEPNWEEYEICQQCLGKQMLVCVIKKINEAEMIREYLYEKGRKNAITEIVFVFEDYSGFSSEDRKKIREVFKGQYLKCIFIQEENLKNNSVIQDWRTEFYRVLEISKIS